MIFKMLNFPKYMISYQNHIETVVGYPFFARMTRTIKKCLQCKQSRLAWPFADLSHGLAQG